MDTEADRTAEKISVNNVEIYYEKCGSGRIVVLMIPGIFGSGSRDFEPQLRGYDKQEFTLVAFDPRGCGRSVPPPRDFPIDYLSRDANDAARLMELLGFNEYCVLGWSDGGTAASILAATYPGRINKLCLGCKFVR
uniref:valacyclovir hydrolase-like n=1 Tax=Styela clava TaxID=7725 RepID=UPI001939C7B7|nr:valacyclovir hydrolase-like [Styela clava]